MKVGSVFLFSVVLIGFLFPSVLPGAFVIICISSAAACLLVPLFSFQPGRRQLLMIPLLLGATLLVLLRTVHIRNSACFPFKESLVCSVRGTLCEDSRISSSNNQVMQVRMNQCTASDGTVGSASGVIAAVGGPSLLLNAGTEIEVSGRLIAGLDGRFFKATAWQVLNPPRRWDFLRVWISDWAINRLGMNEPSSSVPIMLIFGRVTPGAAKIREMAQNAGCLHVLALSGLHLEFFMSFSRFAFFFSRRRISVRILSLVLSIAFVMVVGPMSSLLRAVIFVSVSLCDSLINIGFSKMEKLTLTAILQIAIFPDSILGIKVVYSYVATAGVLLVGRYLSAYLVRIMPEKLAGSIGHGAGAVLATGLVSIRLDGVWHPLSILMTPIASKTVFLMMSVGFARLAFPSAYILKLAEKLLYEWLCDIFRFQYSAGGIAFAVFFLIMLTVCLLIKYSLEKARRKARKDELEFQLRFACGNQGSSGEELPGDVQEIRTEFSD